MKSYLIEESEVNNILLDIKKEISKASGQHGVINSPHESYGILCEEVKEFFDEVCISKNKILPDNARTELIQVAAVCCRTILDLC